LDSPCRTSKPRYRTQRAIAATLSVCYALPAFLFAEIVQAEEHHYDYDLDADGVPDIVSMKKSELSHGNILAEFQIIFSSGAQGIHLKETDSSYFMVYLWRNTPGVLVLDYTNRFTKQASDFYYEVYRWVQDHNKLCLHSTSSGVPPDQLADEVHDSERFVRLYNGCIGIGETKSVLDINDEDYYRKNPVFTFISTARLYNSPNSNDKSNMYLIKGDKVKVKDYKYIKSTGTDWFFIEYQAKGRTEPVIKWIQGESIEPNIR